MDSGNDALACLEWELDRLLEAFRTPLTNSSDCPAVGNNTILVSKAETENSLSSLAGIEDRTENYAEPLISTLDLDEIMRLLDESIYNDGITTFPANSAGLSDAPVLFCPSLNAQVEDEYPQSSALCLHAGPLRTKADFQNWLWKKSNRSQAIQRYHFKKALKFPNSSATSGDDSAFVIKQSKSHRVKYALRSKAASKRPRFQGRFLKRGEVIPGIVEPGSA